MPGGYDNAVRRTTSYGAFSSSVDHSELWFMESARSHGMYYLHTMVESKAKRWNGMSKSLRALGSVRDESTYEKRMREIRIVRARQRRLKQPSELVDDADYEDPPQPPLSQPLLGSLEPTSPEEVYHSPYYYCLIAFLNLIGAVVSQV